MDTDMIGYCNETKEKIKQMYPIVTDEDLYFREGKEKEMLEMLGFKLGLNKEELRDIISTL